MRDTLRNFEDTRYPTLLYDLTDLAGRGEDDDENGEDNGKGTGEPEIQYVTRSSLTVPFDKPWLADTEDVERYLEALRGALMKALEDGKRINI
jgi:hypothetical protein